MRDFQVRNQHTLCEPLTARAVSVLNVTVSTPRRNLRYRRNENSCYGHLVAQYLPVRHVTHNHGATRVGWREKKLTDATAAVSTTSTSGFWCCPATTSQGALPARSPNTTSARSVPNERSALDQSTPSVSTLPASSSACLLCLTSQLRISRGFILDPSLFQK